MDDIDVVVPVYGGLSFLPAFFDNLLAHFPEKSRLIIVDDANDDPALLAFLDAIVTRSPAIKIIRNATNLGFTGSINCGLRAARSHVVILNTDVELPPCWADRLLAPILGQPQTVASVTPFTNAGTICSFPYPNPEKELLYGLSAVTIDSVFARLRPQSRVVQIPTGVGFCMAMSRHALDTVGLFDEAEFARGYGEENDWCMRARAAGLINVQALDIFVFHADGGSFSPCEKSDLLERHYRGLLERHPAYREDVHAYVRENALEGLRTTVAATLALTEKSRKIILVVTFARGGGSYFHAVRIKDEALARGEAVIQVAILSSTNNVRLEIFTPVGHFEFGIGTCEDLSIFFERFAIAKVIINQLYVSADPQRILAFLARQKARYQFILEFLLHDFFCICPSVTLNGSDGRFCGIPSDNAICEACLANSTFDSWAYMPKPASMSDWRVTWKKFFDESCDEIVFFSLSSKRHFLEAYPDVRCALAVRPHRLELGREQSPVNVVFDRLRIGVFGNLSPAKGSGIVEDLCSHIDMKEMPIEVHHFGKQSLRGDFRSLRQHGPYSRSDLHSLIEATGINMTFLPSIWPETFSFVLDELMLLGLPVAVFDFGAQAERTRLYRKGLILSDCDAASVAASIEAFFLKFKDAAEQGRNC